MDFKFKYIDFINELEGEVTVVVNMFGTSYARSKLEFWKWKKNISRT